MATTNKITLCLKRSLIGTTPNQRGNLTGLGLTRRGKWVLLDDTSSNRGMIRKVIHLVDVFKGDKVPVETKAKVSFEVIQGSGETKTPKSAKAEKKASAEPSQTKAVKKTAKKSAKK